MAAVHWRYLLQYSLQHCSLALAQEGDGVLEQHGLPAGLAALAGVGEGGAAVARILGQLQPRARQQGVVCNRQ